MFAVGELGIYEKDAFILDVMLVVLDVDSTNK